MADDNIYRESAHKPESYPKSRSPKSVHRAKIIPFKSVCE